jgi:hypothetical protein
VTIGQDSTNTTLPTTMERSIRVLILTEVCCACMNLSTTLNCCRQACSWRSCTQVGPGNPYNPVRASVQHLVVSCILGRCLTLDIILAEPATITSEWVYGIMPRRRRLGTTTRPPSFHFAANAIYAMDGSRYRPTRRYALIASHRIHLYP